MTSTDDLPEYTAAQIEQHCTHDDLWIIFKDKVYDMTPYFSQHPGGTAMLRKAGKDATLAIHMTSAHSLPWNFILKKLNECCIGRLKKTS